MPSSHPIRSEGDAIEQAARLTGLDALTKHVDARRVVIKDEGTPFLWKLYEGQHAWLVNYDKAALKFKTASPHVTDEFPRKFIVLLDEKTGQLISVHSKFEGHDPDLLEPLSGPAAEAQLKEEDEIYGGLPADGPKLTFLAALEVVLNKGIGSPFAAKEIYGNFVLHSRGDSVQSAAWVITLRGLPPIAAHGAHGDEVPVWQRNHMRNVVDDETGANLFATNSPQP